MMRILLIILLYLSSLYSKNKGSDIFDESGRHDVAIYSYKPMYFGVSTYSNDSTQVGEVKFQLSFKYELFENSNIFLGYTQQSFWSIQQISAPFRASSFSPELFYLLDVHKYTDKKTFLKYIQFGFYGHESTGASKLESRTLHYSYIEPTFKFGDLLCSFKILGPFMGIDIKDAAYPNQDIFEYRGYLETNLLYISTQNAQHSMMLRYYGPTGNYAFQYQFDLDMDYLFSIFGKDNENIWNPKFFIQYFNGYGESINSYNELTHRVTIGFSAIR